MFEVKRACVYTRVSTDAQGEDCKVSLPEQERMCKAGIESKGWYYVRTYEDNGFTGRNTNRPALKRLIEDVKSGEIQAVVFWKLDRLSRNQKDTLTLIEDVFLKYDVGVVSLNETLDTTTPWGRAMIGVLSAFNQLESDNIVERTRMGRYAKAKKGGYAGGKPPIGYKAINGELVIVESEAEIVRTIFQLRSEGNTLVNIRDYLNEHGYRTRKGGLFQHSAVQNILNNEMMYRGYYQYGANNKVDEITHEPILKEEN